MLSVGLWRWLIINITITILDIIHRPVFCLKHNVSETGFCLRLQLQPTQVVPTDRARFYLRRQRRAVSVGSNRVGSTWRPRQNSVSETWNDNEVSLPAPSTKGTSLSDACVLESRTDLLTAIYQYTGTFIDASILASFKIRFSGIWSREVFSKNANRLNKTALRPRRP
jgi:hypothetical protein